MTDTDAAQKFADELFDSVFGFEATRLVQERPGENLNGPGWGKSVIANKVASLLAAAEVEAGKWVDVKERLPEESDWYLVRFEDLINHDPQKPRVEFFHSCLGEWETNPNVIRVTHWMPLPTVPTQQEEQVNG